MVDVDKMEQMTRRRVFTIKSTKYFSVSVIIIDLYADDGQVTKQEFTTELLRATQGVCDMNAVRLYSEQLFLLVAQPTQNSVPLARLGNLFDITDTNGKCGGYTKCPGQVLHIAQTSPFLQMSQTQIIKF